MRSQVKHILCGLIFLFAGLSSFASAPYYLADSGNTYYSKGNYAKAINAYTRFLDNGYESANVYYNLGNCYYRNNEIAKAILYYEKAKKLAPEDADVQFNLQIANQKTTDKIAQDNQLFFVSWWDNFVNMASEKGWAVTCILFLCVGLLFILFYFLSPNLLIRQLSFWGGILMFILSLSSFVLAQQQYRITTAHDTAIIMSPTVTAKGAPAENATQLFVIHEGAKVHIIKTNGNWVEVKLANGNQGWMQLSDIAAI